MPSILLRVEINKKVHNIGLTLEAGGKVSELTQRLSQRFDVPTNTIRLINQGKVLSPEVCLTQELCDSIICMPITKAPQTHAYTPREQLHLYIENRAADKRTTFGFFDAFFGGHTRETKLSAARKLNEFLNDSAGGKLILTTKEAKALTQGRLKNIVDQLSLSPELISIDNNLNKNTLPSLR